MHNLGRIAICQNVNGDASWVALDADEAATPCHEPGCECVRKVYEPSTSRGAVSADPMTTETAEMFMRQRDEARARVEQLEAALRKMADPDAWDRHERPHRYTVKLAMDALDPLDA